MSRRVTAITCDMDIKSAIKSISLTSFSLLIGSAALAIEVNKTNCPNDNTNLNEIVVWEEQSDGKRSPKIINLEAKIITKKGRFDCQVQWMDAYMSEWIIKCNNESTISSRLSFIHVKDKQGSTYKMERLDINFTVTCKENEVIYRQKQTAYQKSFDFDIIIESTYKRKKTPPPAGF